MRIGISGASASLSFVSWTRRTSGCALASHFSTASWRALSEFTFQVAIRIGRGYRPSDRFGHEEEAPGHGLVGRVHLGHAGALVLDRRARLGREFLDGGEEAVAGGFRT